MFDHYKIILASGSPRRKKILKDMGMRFSVRTVNTREDFPADLPADQIAEYLAVKKAEAYGRPGEDEIVITADTTVVHRGKVLNKPEGKEEAARMLRDLSGSDHCVYSGVCIQIHGEKHSFTEATKVSFYELDEAEIQNYIKECKPFDKAGSYGIQEKIGLIAVKSISGNYDNVVGLPASRVYRELKKLTAEM